MGCGAQRILAVAALLGAAAAGSGCGQRGPLALPDAARPVQRVEPSAPGSGTQAPPESTDEEKGENER
jgi:predicted small lipoprotein YifL